MAVSSGFFDAVLEGSTPDRSYNSVDFVNYFNHVIGSGVAISDNENSMKVSVSGNTATVAPGYLFIDGYWLENDADFDISLSAASVGNYAIVARLSKANRTIILRYEPIAEQYQDCLVLATLTKSAVGGLNALVDTRADTNLCGTLQSLGSLSDAINAALVSSSDLSAQIAAFQVTLDNQSQQIANKFTEVDTIESQKISEANALLASTESPVIGTVQYSAQTPGSKWLKCDGSYVDGTVYQELVTLLHISEYPLPAPVDTQIATGTEKVSNFVLIDGCAFYYLIRAKELKKIDLNTKTITPISYTGLDDITTSAFVQLSLTDGALILVQEGTSVIYESTQALSSQTNSITFNAHGIGGIVFKAGSFHTVAKVPRGSSYPDQYIYRVYDSPTNSDYLGFTAYRYSSYTNDTVLLCPGDTRQSKIPFGLIPVIGYLPKFDNRDITVKFDTIALNNETYHKTTLQGYTTDLEYQVLAEEDTDFVSDSVIRTNNTAVLCDNKFLYGALIENNKLILYVSSLSQFRIQKKQFNFTLPNRATIFMDAACYLEDSGLFVMFIGTGFFFAYDLLDPGTYGYYNTTDLIGTLISDVYCEYDAINKKLYLIGKDTNSQTHLYCFDVSSWEYSNTGAYLPIIHNGSIDGYIKALE